MISIEGHSLGIYLFSRRGRPLLAAPAGERLPIEPLQLAGVLAIAGGFDDPGARGPAGPVARVQYDEYGILGMRGEHAVAATVSRDTPDEILIPELERFLRRCERRLRHFERD